MLRLALRPVPYAAFAALILFCVSSVRGDDAKPAPKAEKKAEEKKSDEAPASPRKIVLLAGPRDEGHPVGTHEYDNTVATIKAALEASNVADRVKVETHTNGWPEDPATLDDADTILLVSSGSDRDEAHHPFLVGDRMQVLGKQMDRGCGLVLLHWSVFVPIKYEKEFHRWVGGFFDYQRGDDPRGWFSAITFATAKIAPNEKHPIAKGVVPFDHKDEYYYNIRFAKDDKRVTPIVTVRLPEVEEPQVVAWAVKRKDGGRGFAFTGGHFQHSWENEAYRTLLLNALCWTAKVPIPAGGVHKPLAFDDKWTPKRHVGKTDLPAEKESDWVDARIRETDVGPFYTTSLVAPDENGVVPDRPRDDRKDEAPNPNMVVKAIAIKLGGKDGLPPAAVLFDKETMTLRCGWTGGFLNFSDRRFGLLEKPTIGGDVQWSLPRSDVWKVSPPGEPAWRDDTGAPTDDLRFHGLQPVADGVVLSYSVAGCGIRESASMTHAGDAPVLLRTFEIEPTVRRLELPIGLWPGFRWTFEGALLEKGQEAVIAEQVSPSEGTISSTLQFRIGGDRCDLIVLPFDKPQRFGVALWQGPRSRADAVMAGIDALPPVEPLPARGEDLTRRWGEPLVTKGVVGTPEPGSPFAVDTITIPYDNPHKALFFAGGFDFAPDGTCYLCTAHGDVWKVTGIDEDLDEVKWQRFATGLYEPLGLKVRDGEVFVLGRDQITRLHDENGDGEADFYECFNDDLTDRGEAHAYAMCLETDAEGNFYFLKSGAVTTPHGGSLIKVSADGKTLETYATGFRHPNGLSIGPDGTITAADNEGNWVPVTRLDIVERGEFCGHVPTAHREPEPTDPGQPLCWLPVVLDNSAGGQAWVPEGAWGPLAGRLLHLSFGRCTANLILKERVDGVWQGGAVPLPLPRFLSGICRGRFRTAGEGADGHLYLCGLNGWSSAAAADGNFQRVRYVGGPLRVPTDLRVFENGLELTFPEPIDRDSVDPARFAVEVWNYRWTKEYGSEDYSAADPTRAGRDALAVTAASLSADGRTVFVAVEGLKPVMQLRLQAGLKAADGSACPVDYYGTVHGLRPANSGIARSAGALR